MINYWIPVYFKKKNDLLISLIIQFLSIIQINKLPIIYSLLLGSIIVYLVYLININIWLISSLILNIFLYSNISSSIPLLYVEYLQIQDAYFIAKKISYILNQARLCIYIVQPYFMIIDDN